MPVIKGAPFGPRGLLVSRRVRQPPVEIDRLWLYVDCIIHVAYTYLPLLILGGSYSTSRCPGQTSAGKI